jgi:hypothetical protein
MINNNKIINVLCCFICDYQLNIIYTCMLYIYDALMCYNVACGVGTWSSATGATVVGTCTSCLAGTYSAVVGATSISTCSTCSAGTYSLAGSSVCVSSCAGGTFASGSTCVSKIFI